MDKVIPLRPKMKRINNHVEFYSFCLEESSRCKFFSPTNKGCAHAVSSKVGGRPFCTSFEAQKDAFQKILGNKKE